MGLGLGLGLGSEFAFGLASGLRLEQVVQVHLICAIGAEPLVRLLYEQRTQDGHGPRRDVVLGREVYLACWPGSTRAW